MTRNPITERINHASDYNDASKARRKSVLRRRTENGLLAAFLCATVVVIFVLSWLCSSYRQSFHALNVERIHTERSAQVGDAMIRAGLVTIDEDGAARWLVHPESLAKYARGELGK